MRLQTGYVKYFNPNKGVGLITPAKGGDDLFVNRSAIAMPNKSLQIGQMVEFTIHRGAHGLAASDVIGI